MTAPRRIARNAVVRMVGEVVAKLGSLVFYVTMARQLGTGGFGEFQFALALTGALVFICGFGTDELLAREVARDKGRAGRLLADAVAIKLLGGVVALIAAVVIVNVGDYSAQSRMAVYVVGLGSLVEVLSKSWFSIFQGYERLDLVSLMLIVQRFSTAAIGVVVLLAGGGVVAASAVYAGCAILAVVVGEVLLHRIGVKRARTDSSEWLPLVKLGIPIGLIGLLMTLLLRLDVTMLSFLATPAIVGIYAVALRLVEATQFIGSAMAMAMLPWLSRARLDAGRGYRLGLKAVTAALLPVSMILILYADPIIHLLYGKAFADADLPLQLLAPMALLYGLNAYAASSLIARDRPGVFVRPLGPIIVLNIVLNLILIPRHGADGAAITALVCSALLAVISMIQGHHVIGVTDPLGTFSGPTLAAAAMTAVALGLKAPWIPEAVLATLVYAVVLAAFEWLTRRDDARAFLDALPRSRSRAGRTAA